MQKMVIYTPADAPFPRCYAPEYTIMKSELIFLA